LHRVGKPGIPLGTNGGPQMAALGQVDRGTTAAVDFNAGNLKLAQLLGFPGLGRGGLLPCHPADHQTK